MSLFTYCNKFKQNHTLLKRRTTQDGEHLNIAKHKEYLNTLKLHKELVECVKEEMRIKFLLTEELYAPNNRSLNAQESTVESQVLTSDASKTKLENNSHLPQSL